MSNDMIDTIEAWIDDLLDDEHPPAQTLATAQGVIRAYRDDANAGFAWTGLDKATWCARVELLISNPTLLNQRPTFYCAPAACLYVLLKRVPEIMARFCAALGRDGTGSIGDLTITMTPKIRAFDTTAFAREQRASIDPVDYILLLAGQNAMSITNIEKPDDYAARPGILASNMSDFLKKTDLFEVTVESNPKVADFATHAAPNTEIILAANMGLFSSRTSPEHAAVLVPPLVEQAGLVTLRFWSWGMFQGEHTLPVEGGAYVNRLGTRNFEAKISKAIFVKLQT